MLARTLITTADERTWPDLEDEPVLFLGEWCKRYSRMEKWGGLNAIVAPYHWDDRKMLYEDYQYLQKLYESLLVELSDKLNHIHSVKYSLNYWRILIGPWLGYFIQMLFDRWSMLDQSIEKLECINCRIIERNPLSVTPNDMDHFDRLVKEDDWNEAIYGQLLEKCFTKLIKIEKIQLKEKNKNKHFVIRQGWKIRLKSQLKKWVIGLSKLLPNEVEYFFISSCLPLKTELILQLRLGQFPRFWRTQQLPDTRSDMRKRQWQLDGNKFNDNSFELIARQFIPLHMPRSYLEGYEQLMQTIDLLPWPKRLKVIFTSTSYEYDDLFKAWAAEKVETKTPLIIGQHGGHFGMSPFSFGESHQINIATKWLSWGWSDSSKPQITPMGNLKSLGKSVSYDPNGGALMVEMTNSRYSYHLCALPISSQLLNYLAVQKKFLQALPQKLREQVLLKLYPHDYGWDQFERWQEEMPEVHLESGAQDIIKLIEKSRLYISTYNATTYLESLSWDIPTIIFWDPEYFELKTEVKPYFELLESVGIFHQSPESAAHQMIKVWDNIDVWWESVEVQKVRKQFCHQFSRNPDNLIGDLQTLFNNISP